MGNLAFVINDPKLVPAIKSQVTWVVRGMYSNPPAHGARVVAAVLKNQQLFDEWSVCHHNNVPDNHNKCMKFTQWHISEHPNQNQFKKFIPYILNPETKP